MLRLEKSTTYTEIKRLSQKGYLQNQNAIVTATTSREQVQAHASELFVEHTFGGSLPCFLATFAHSPFASLPLTGSILSAGSRFTCPARIWK